jgi:lipopolysaccharide/colanic/teichoic acid biosynthesis glycosyltransferase
MTTVVEAKAIVDRTSSSPRALPQVCCGLKRPPLPGDSAKDSVSGRPTQAQTSQASTERHTANTRPVPLWKRCSDIFCILLSLPITLPSMAAVMLWIKFVSRGPALFRQERIGRNGKRFVLYKFRSMKMHADTTRHQSHFMHLVRSDSPMVKLDLMRDSRMIQGGCFLRAAGLDELPQLFNVLRGEMSLVGPRPCLPEEFCLFTPEQMERFAALPGLTGIWQVNGKGVSTFSEMNAMDARYVQHSSPSLDFGIMMRTPYALAGQMYKAFQQYRATHESFRVAGSNNRPIPGDSPVSGYSTQRLV